MKSEIVMKEEGRKYPWLGHGCIGNTDWEKIVLFTAPSTGTVVSAIGNLVILGEHYTEWLEEQFSEFEGKVILSND